MDKTLENQEKLNQELAEIKKLSETFGSFVKELAVLKDKKEIFGKSKPVSTKPEKPGETEPDEDDVNAKVNKMADHMNKMHNDMYNSMHTMANYLHQRIDNLHDKHYTHANVGHLPPLGPGEMNKVLKTCGLDESYTVAKKNVSCASSNKNVRIIEIDFHKK